MLINLVKKNIIKFTKIISFLFEQINTGGYKINNFWILLKRSLTIWIFPVFLISLLFNQITITNNVYLLLFSFLYITVIILNYFKNNMFISIINRFFLMFLSFFIFINNKEITTAILFTAIILCFFIVLIYIIKFFFYKKIRKAFILNFSKISCFMEFILVISVLFFGIKNLITVNILFVVMFDIFYKVIILSIILNLKKRFSIQ